jgi:hypothetical protein
MWISRLLYDELTRTRVLAENLAAELAATRARIEERAAASVKREAALESLIADLRTQVAVKNNSFDWLSTSHERIERWYADLMAAKLEVRIATSSVEREYVPGGIPSSLPRPTEPRPAGEGVRASDDDPSDIESQYRQKSAAIFEDVGDAIATRENLETVEYAGIEPVIAQG